MNGGEVHRLVAVADAGRAVSEVGNHDAVVSAHPVGEGCAHSLRDVCPDDVGYVDQADVGIRAVRGELARSAEGFTLLSEEAGHYLDGGHAEHEHDGEVAVVDVELVLALLQSGYAANLPGLVSLGGGDDGSLALAVEHPDAFVQDADEGHLAVHFEEVGVG